MPQAVYSDSATKTTLCSISFNAHLQSIAYHTTLQFCQKQPNKSSYPTEYCFCPPYWIYDTLTICPSSFFHHKKAKYWKIASERITPISHNQSTETCLTHWNWRDHISVVPGTGSCYFLWLSLYSDGILNIQLHTWLLPKINWQSHIQLGQFHDDVNLFHPNHMHNKDFCYLTHWGRVTHICVSKLSILGSDNGLSPGQRQAII